MSFSVFWGMQFLSIFCVCILVVTYLCVSMQGLLREVIMASVFGVGPVATAFKYCTFVKSESVFSI